jgi:hypothetical protein
MAESSSGTGNGTLNPASESLFTVLKKLLRCSTSYNLDISSLERYYFISGRSFITILSTPIKEAPTAGADRRLSNLICPG